MDSRIRMKWMLWLASSILVGAAAGAECITVYDAAAPPDCGLLVPETQWMAVTPPGEVLLFKNLWGKGKTREGRPFEGPKKAGVAMAGPLCWTGTAPTLMVDPTAPDDGVSPPWDVPPDTDWQAVVRGGFCQVCCTGSF